MSRVYSRLYLQKPTLRLTLVLALLLATVLLPDVQAQALINNDFNSNASGWAFTPATAGNNWRYEPTSGIANTGCLRHKTWSADNAATYSAGLALAAGTTYQVQFQTWNDGINARKVDLYFNSIAGKTGATVFFSTPTLPFKTWQQYTATFTVPTTGI